jgi:DnaK suppressor protein
MTPGWLIQTSAIDKSGKDHETMTNIELNAFRTVLESRQTDLRNGSKGREALAIETSPDELDRIQHASDRDMAIDNLERDSSQLVEVRSALRRVDAGAFGFCVGCEEKITPKRLAAVPWASFCIVCQEALDREKAPWSDIETSLVMAA